MSGPRAAGASVVALVAIEVLAALAAYEGWSRIARAENLPASAPTESADAAADDSGPARQEPVASPPSVALSGPVACALASAGEAIFIGGDHASIEVGANGFSGLVAYPGPDPIACLLQDLAGHPAGLAAFPVALLTEIEVRS